MPTKAHTYKPLAQAEKVYPGGWRGDEAPLHAAYHHGCVYASARDPDGGHTVAEIADWFYLHAPLARESFLCGFETGSLGHTPLAAALGCACQDWIRLVMSDPGAKSPRWAY